MCHPVTVFRGKQATQLATQPRTPILSNEIAMKPAQFSSMNSDDLCMSTFCHLQNATERAAISYFAQKSKMLIINIVAGNVNQFV